MKKLLDAKTETEVVAYIARGDSYDDILKVLLERGIKAQKSTLSDIKKRNTQALEFMQKALAENQLSHASSILRKSRELLERKLDHQLVIADAYKEAKKLYDNGEIDFASYVHELDRIAKTELSASELNSITKESFNQSQVEAGKPTAITETPSQARKNLEIILQAIASGDDMGAVKALFPDA